MATMILHLNAYVKVVPPLLFNHNTMTILELNAKLLLRINIWLKPLREAQNS
jgi:hypothetical protein